MSDTFDHGTDAFERYDCHERSGPCQVIKSIEDDRPLLAFHSDKPVVYCRKCRKFQPQGGKFCMFCGGTKGIV